MPEGHTPPRHTSRLTASSGKIPVPGHRPPTTSAMKPVPTPAPMRTGTTARRAPPQASKPEVVASSDDAEVSQVRQRVSHFSFTPRGLSLRWKIVTGMAAITVATAILIFIVVYTKSVAQLNDEIDTKGVRLVKTLASIDAVFWKTAIGGAKDDRRKKVDAFVQKFNPDWTESLRDRQLRVNADLRALYESMVDPLGPLAPLKGPKGDVGGPDSDIMQMSVLDLGVGEGGSVQAAEGTGEKGITVYSASKRRDPAGVDISDGMDKATNREVRLFIMEKDTPQVARMRYSVILSLDHINEAKGSLLRAILLPILISILLGTGIAIWMSTLITEPVKVLMHDMHQVSEGNLEHQTIPRSSDEIGLLASTFNRMTTALRAAHDQEIQAKAMEHDLAIASEIQSNLVPKRMLKIPGYDVSAYYRPSKEVGGDYYDFIEIDEENEGIIVADVSGKGVPGSLVMTMARAFIRMEAERSRNTSPSDSLIRANHMLAQDIKKGMFVTALYCILNKRTNEIRVASAGHNPLVVWRAGANKVELVNPNGIALGFDKGPVFERTIKEERIVLGRGDRIVAFTDGTVEAMNAANQEFGDDRFYALIKQLATRDSNQMLNLVVKALDEHKGNAPQSDDITIVTLRYI